MKWPWGKSDPVRRRLLDRRRNITCQVTFRNQSQQEFPSMAVTYGLDTGGMVREVFCSTGQEGTDIKAILHDACIAISLALQYGASLSDFDHTFGSYEIDGERQPSSLLGLFVRVGIEAEAQERSA